MRCARSPRIFRSTSRPCARWRLSERLVTAVDKYRSCDAARERYIVPLPMKNILQHTDLKRRELPKWAALERELKRERGKRGRPTPLKGQRWAMIFSKPST